MASPQKSAAGSPSFTPGEGGDIARWSISTRSIGEVLTTDIRCDGLRMMLFSKPSDQTAQEVDRRLGALFENEAAPSEPSGGPQSVPAVLHRAIVLLRGLVAEAERATERPAGAVAFYYSRSEIACACLGGGEPDVWSHGRPFNAPWLAVHPGGGDTRRASSSIRLFSLRIRADLDMRLRWPCLLEGATPEGVIVDANWNVPPGLRVIVRSMSGETLYAPRDGDETNEGGGTTDARGDFFAGWFDDLTSGSDTPDTRERERPVDRFSELVSELRDRVEGKREEPGVPLPGPWQGTETALHPAPPTAAGADVDEADPRAGIGQTPSGSSASERGPGSAATAGEFAARELPGAAPEEKPSAEVPGSEGVPATPSRRHDVTPRAWRMDGVRQRVLRRASAPVAVDAPGAHVGPAGIASGPVTDASPEALAGGESGGAIREAMAASAAPIAPLTVRRPEWPVFQRQPAVPIRWGWLTVWIAIPAALFALGLWVGGRGDGSPSVPGRPPAPLRMLRALGFGGARYTLRVTSTPQGAALAVDGRRITPRTPAELDLKPGRHRVTVWMPDLGQVVYDVTGRSGQQVPLEVPLLGKLTVQAPDVVTPVAVTIDGEPRGFAPVRSTGVEPGTHELEFSTLGQPPWSETVRVPVRGDVTIVARPFELPATGVIEVRATVTDDDGVHDAADARVWVDGERGGATPLRLELARGPHSLRAEYRGEASPVQVIDLPGGNERYATFSFGTGADVPRPVQQTPTGYVTPAMSTPVSVSVPGMRVSDVRESWLHVKGPNGEWSRYPMTLLPGGAGVVAVVVFPAAQLDAHGDALYYVSVLSVTGEEYYTEMRNAGPPPQSRAPHPSHLRAAAATPADPPPAVTTPEAGPASTEPDPDSAPPVGVPNPPEPSTEPSTP